MPQNPPAQRSLPFGDSVESRGTYIKENHGTMNVNNNVILKTFREAPKTESKTDGAQVKLTSTQKLAVKTACEEDGIGVSTFIAEAIDHKLALRGREKKFENYQDAVFALLDSLP